MSVVQRSGLLSLMLFGITESVCDVKKRVKLYEESSFYAYEDVRHYENYVEMRRNDPRKLLTAIPTNAAEGLIIPERVSVMPNNLRCEGGINAY